MDLLASLILTLVATVTPLSQQPQSTAPPPTPRPEPTPIWSNPYQSIHGHSPLRREYQIPSGQPSNLETANPNPPTNFPFSTPSIRAPSSPPSNLDTCASKATTTCEDEQEDADEYDPEYASYLVASVLSTAEQQQQAEKEEIERIQQVLGDRKRAGEARLACVVGDKMVGGQVGRYLGDGGRCVRRGRMNGLDTKEEGTMGGGMSGKEGCWGLRAFFEGAGGKKRSVEDDGGEEGEGERGAKRRRGGR